MRAFIIRPFGTKSGIDFDRVEAELIGPALDRLQLEGRTTGDVIEAGNIREDMFQLLLVADIVVADISIDNPNAYYELGIRHALREKRTFLIRGRGMTNDVPFDLRTGRQMRDVPFDVRTDRYMPYDPADPGASVEHLFQGLKATLASERQDSPVFRMLPELREQDRSKFLPLPREFREDVEYAARSRQPGLLALLAREVQAELWAPEGLRIVGREQFAAKAFEGAAATLEALRRVAPLDKEANLLLGTIYQRLGDLAKSEVALRRVAGHPDVPPKERAEAFSLLGRNLKTQWRESWVGLEGDRRRRQALRSPLLMASFEAYLKGFRQDLNHFYSGLNALAMLTILVKLAAELPDTWADRFATDDEGQHAKTQLERQRQLIAGAVEFSVQSSKQYLEQTGQTDPWVDVSLADFCLLTSERPGQVASAYERALAGQPPFVSDSVRSQLRLYEELGLLATVLERVREVLPAEIGGSDTSRSPARTLVFTGHQVDAPGRSEPRFPPDKEPVAREAIRDVVRQQLARYGSAIGIAGGASGGDIIFHEVCQELDVPTRLYLALPPETYVTESVSPGGADWVSRFWALHARFPSAPVLSRSKELPRWLRHPPDGYGIWQRNNLWTLNEALSGGASNVTVIALWNGRAGDGPGGTADMIATARSQGAEVRVIDTNVLFGFAPAGASSEG